MMTLLAIIGVVAICWAGSMIGLYGTYAVPEDKGPVVYALPSLLCFLITIPLGTYWMILFL